MQLILGGVERDDGDREGCLIVLKVELEDGGGLSLIQVGQPELAVPTQDSKLTSTGSIILKHDAHCPAPPLGSPNTSVGSSKTSSSTSIPTAF